jgi:hypothetical protein
MTTTTATPTTPELTADEKRTLELMKAYRAAITEYGVTTGARRAQHGRKINALALEISLLDEVPETFEWWVKPSPVTIKSYVHTPDELTARIAKLRALVAREDLPEIAKSTADRELSNCLEQAEKRGVAIPDAA